MKMMNNTKLKPDDDFPDELRSAALWYAAQPQPQPTPKSTQRLLADLLAEETRLARKKLPLHQPLFQTLRIARWQLYLLGPWFWIAGALLLLFSCIVAPTFSKNTPTSILIYTVPLTAILSVVYALRRLSRGMRDVEVSCPAGFIETMGGLVIAIICFDSLFGLIGTLVIVFVQQASFGTLLASWLGPLLLLVSLSFPVALRWGTFHGVLIGGGPWLVIIVLAELFPASLTHQLVFVSRDGLSMFLHLLAAGIGALILGILLMYGSKWQRLLIQY
jgi:hypothetical protein